MDTDYCFRVQLQCQVPLTFVPEALVYVRYRDTLRGMLRQTRERAIANVALARRYSQQQGESKRSLSPWLSYARRWLRQLGRLTKIRQREQFAEWLRMNAWLIGLLQGSLLRHADGSPPDWFQLPHGATLRQFATLSFTICTPLTP